MFKKDRSLEDLNLEVPPMQLSLTKELSLLSTDKSIMLILKENRNYKKLENGLQNSFDLRIVNELSKITIYCIFI